MRNPIKHTSNLKVLLVKVKVKSTLTFFLKKNKETKQEKVKLKLQHLLSINKYSLGQKDTAENKTNKNMM